MQAIAQRFDAWLAEHALSGTLNAGGDAAALDRLEAVIGKELPGDFRAYYRIHDGQQPYPAPQLIDLEELLSVDRILDERKIWFDLLVDKGGNRSGFPHPSEPDGGIKNDWYNEFWVPFTYNGSGDHLCLDLDPATGGTYGQVIRMWHDDPRRPLIATSFRDFMTEYVDGLYADLYLVGTEEYRGIVRKDTIA